MTVGNNRFADRNRIAANNSCIAAKNSIAADNNRIAVESSSDYYCIRPLFLPPSVVIIHNM